MRLALTLAKPPEGPILRNAVTTLIAAATSLLFSAPAFAAGSTALPEPGSLTLLSMGVVGLIIGRRAARKPPRD